jgi:hypothetical protein
MIVVEGEFGGERGGEMEEGFMKEIAERRRSSVHTAVNLGS